MTNKFLLKNQECFFRKFITNLDLRVTELQIEVEPFQVQDWIHFVRHNRLFLEELLLKRRRRKKELGLNASKDFQHVNFIPKKKEYSDGFSKDQSQIN